MDLPGCIWAYLRAYLGLSKHIKAYLVNLGCGDLIRAAMSIDEPSELTDFLGRRDLEDRLELSY